MAKAYPASSIYCEISDTGISIPGEPALTNGVLDWPTAPGHPQFDKVSGTLFAAGLSVVRSPVSEGDVIP